MSKRSSAARRLGMTDVAHVLAHPSDWSGGGDDAARRDHRLADRDTFMIHLLPSHHAELRHAVDALTAALGPAAAAAGVGEEGEPAQSVLATITSDDFPLEPPNGGNMCAMLLDIWHKLVDGAGLVLLNKIPLEQFRPAEVALIYVGIGAHLGTAVPQSDELGDVLGFVKPADGSMAVRGYRNTADQALHTDGTVDFVGMLCIRPAEGGNQGQGISRYSSCTAAYNDIVRRDPAVLSTLFRGFRYHLGENTAVVWDDSVPTITPFRVPVLSWGPRILGSSGGSSKDAMTLGGVGEPQDALGGNNVDCVNVRYLRSYIDDAAYELKTGKKLRFDDSSSKVDRTSLQIHQADEQAALDLWHERIDANSVELLLNPGELVFFNNRRIMHSRSGFEDRKRLLFRLWLRSHHNSVATPSTAIDEDHLGNAKL